MSDEIPVLSLARFNGFAEDNTILIDTEDQDLSVTDLRIGGTPRAGEVVIVVRQGDNMFVCGATAIKAPSPEDQ